MLGFCNITDHEHTSEIRVLSLMKCSCETRFKMIPSLLFYIIFPQWGEGRYSLRKEYINTKRKINNIIPTPTHVQNKCFALKFKFRRNASKFPIFI